MNGILGKSRFNSLMILQYTGSSSSIIIGKNKQKLRKETTNPVRWSTRGGDFYTNYTSELEIVLPKLYFMKSVAWNFHVCDLQGKHMYNMILGHDILCQLRIDLFPSKNTIRGNVGAHKRCKALMKDIWKINFNTSSN